MRWQSASESLSSEILRSNHRNRPRLRFIRFQRFLGQQRGQFSCGQFSTETPKLANGNGHGAPIGPSTSPAQQDQMSTVRSAGKNAVREKTASRKAKLARSLLKKKWAANRHQTGWSVAIVAAKTLLQVSSSGVIADAESVSVNARARPHGSGRRRQRSNVTRIQGPDSEGFGLFFFSAKFQCRA